MNLIKSPKRLKLGGIVPDSAELNGREGIIINNYTIFGFTELHFVFGRAIKTYAYTFCLSSQNIFLFYHLYLSCFFLTFQKFQGVQCTPWTFSGGAIAPLAPTLATPLLIIITNKHKQSLLQFQFEYKLRQTSFL